MQRRSKKEMGILKPDFPQVTKRILELLIQDSPTDPEPAPPSAAGRVSIETIAKVETENLSETSKTARTGSTPAKPAAEPVSEKEDLDFLESLLDSGRDAAAAGKIASPAVTKQTAAEDEEWLEDFLES